jgi:hypothetical protein
LCHLDSEHRQKRKEHLEERLAVVINADEELMRFNLQCEVVLNFGRKPFKGMCLTLPDGSVHRIPKNAPAETFFIIPESVFACGAAAIWQSRRHGFLPVSHDGLKLLIVLLSEEREDRYGGINPAVVHIRTDGSLYVNEQRLGLPASLVSAALPELEKRSLLIRESFVISRLGGFMVRRGDRTESADETAAQIFQIQRGIVWTAMDGRSSLVRAVTANLDQSPSHSITTSCAIDSS